MAIGIGLLVLFMSPTVSFPDDLEPIKLLSPQINRGIPLMRALKQRSSSREYSTEKLPLRELSNMLRAAFCVIHAESGKRTAPSAFDNREPVNRQSIWIKAAVLWHLRYILVQRKQNDRFR